MKIVRANCPACGPGPAVCAGFPHLAHAVLALLTCGLWSPVWALCWRFDIGAKTNCQRCGRPVR